MPHTLRLRFAVVASLIAFPLSAQPALLNGNRTPCDAGGNVRSAQRQPEVARENLRSTTPADEELRDFFMQAGRSGRRVMVISRAVRPHIKNQDVRNFNDRLIEAHSRTNARLAELAQEKGFTLGSPKEDLAEEWKNRPWDVDEDYLGEVIGDYQAVIEIYQEAARRLDNEVATFVGETLIELREHLTEATRLKSLVE